MFRRGRWYAIDLRYIGAGRPTMRDPSHPAWPNAGERTELADIAERWKWSYVDRYHEAQRERVTGRRKARRLTDAVREYLEHRSVTVSRSTWENDRTALGHLADDFGNADVHTVDPQRTLNRLLSAGYRTYTVETYAAFLGSFWRWLGLPFEVTLPSRQKSEPRVWSDAEVAKIRDAAGDLLVAVDCGLYMGLRRGEIYGLEWADVDLSQWTVRVRRQNKDEPLKSRKRRTALILPGWQHPPAEGRVAEPGKPERMVTLLKRVGLYEPGTGYHSFRHTYARMFLERKPDLRLLQASLGHGSIKTTEESYNHLLPDRAAALARDAIHSI